MKISLFARDGVLLSFGIVHNTGIYISSFSYLNFLAFFFLLELSGVRLSSLRFCLAGSKAPPSLSAVAFAFLLATAGLFP
jgi:hypothetical protein